ncbi:MAG: diguanylate cyclase [Planctomycetes bacterium]|nr:diguanylate cyclase [Planctomycetota bacterium]
MSEDFEALYNTAHLPVLVCRRDDPTQVVFRNPAAKLTAAVAMDEDPTSRRIVSLADALPCKRAERYHALISCLGSGGCVDGMDVELASPQGGSNFVRVYANAATVGGNEYFILYLVAGDRDGERASRREVMAQILEASYRFTDANDAIQAILSLAGAHAGASRAFIFEDISPDTARNTYEWCAPGVEPIQHKLQNLDRDSFDYKSFTQASGMLISSDTCRLPLRERETMLSNGIKSLAILSLYHYDAPLGFIGYNDCRSRRQWTREDVQLLQDTASIVSSLISRRDAENKSRMGRAVLQTVTDNLEEMVYVSDPETSELKFVSKSLQKAIRKPLADIIGQPCWQVLHRHQNGVCSFCPVPKVLERERDGEGGSYIWELHNRHSGKWYMVKDCLVDWIDGKRAHLGTFVDITYRKQYEEQLKRFASTDAMTDVYNRKWGTGKLAELFQAPAEERARQSLAFIDIDGLKAVNDRLGHQVGDEMIVNIIRILFSCIRKDDFIVRWGGDEFLLFLNCPLSDAQRVMEKIAFGLDHFNAHHHNQYRASVSYGLVDFSEPFASLNELVGEADKRMYNHKSQKKRQPRPSSRL